MPSRPAAIAAAHRLISLCAGLVTLLACGDSELAAHWRDRDITVDGKLDDWSGLQAPLPGVAARAAIANDGEALYLSLETADPEVARMISHRGLTVWFDPRGGREQVLGVRFPLPAVAPPSRWGEVGGSRPGGAQLDNVELLGPQPYTRKEVAAPGADGVVVAVGGGAGVVTYELRVPLATAQGWGLGVAPGSKLGVGLESKGFAGGPGGRRGGADGGGGPGGGGPGDGPPGGRGGSGGGFGGRGRGPAGGFRELSAWSVVTLAQAGR